MIDPAIILKYVIVVGSGIGFAFAMFVCGFVIRQLYKQKHLAAK
jgi:hypothetical protein